MGESKYSPQCSARLLAFAAGLLVAGLGAQTPPPQGVLAFLNPAAVSSFDARHDTNAIRLNSARDLYLVTAADGRTDQQLLNELETDPAAGHPELNRTLPLAGPKSDLDAFQSTASVLNGGQSTASVLNSTQPLGLTTGRVLNLKMGLFGSQSSLSNDAAAVLRSRPVHYYGSVVPARYIGQPVVEQIEADRSAHDVATGRNVVVALIDNGLDPSNPVLARTWSGEKGWNFYDNTADWSAYADLADGPMGRGSQIDLGTIASLDGGTSSPTPSANTCAVEFGSPGSHLDQSTASVLNGGQSTASVLNGGQSTASVLNGVNTQTQALAAVNALLACDPDFGHGTSVAGLIHLVAPDAKILPIKAFGPGGTATVAAIYQSITYAIDQHVQVINMSFSAQATTPAIQAAIQEAVQDGIVVVAAAGNAAADAAVFPASLPGVIGAGAADGTRSAFPLASFSNFDPGPGQFVDAAVGAPGVNLFTTYPGGGQIWATVSGTSFSAPLVAGEAALLEQLGVTGAANARAIAKAADPAIAGNTRGQLGYGLINVDQALKAAGQAPVLRRRDRGDRRGH
jgi:subtilisin family serine protease